MCLLFYFFALDWSCSRFNPWATSTGMDYKPTSVKKTEGDRPRVPSGSRSGKGFRTVTLDNGSTINHLTY